MAETFPVRLIKSRFFISSENLETAIKNVHIGSKKDLEGGRPNCFNPIEPPTPWSDPKSLLEILGFNTHVADDKSVWISDFEDTEMTWFQFRIIINTLVHLSKTDPLAFIYMEREKLGSIIPFRVEGGRLFSGDDECESLKFNRFPVGKTPFHALPEWFD